MRLAVTGTLNSALFDSLLTQCAPCVRGEDLQLEIDLSSADWAYPSPPHIALNLAAARENLLLRRRLGRDLVK